MTAEIRGLIRLPCRQSDGRDEGSSFTEPVFDDDYYGREPASGKGRTIGLVIGVLVGGLAAGGAAYYVLGGGGSTPAEPPLIAADRDPFRVKPDDPGGMEVENQDKLVYERVGPDGGAPGVEQLLPAPEQPVAPMPPLPDQADSAASDEVAQPLPEPESAGISDETPATSMPTTEVETLPEPQTAPSPAETEAMPQPAAPVITEEQPEPQQPLPEPEVAAVPQAATSGDSVSPLSGEYLIQLSAVREEDAAHAEWERLSGRFENVLGRLAPVVVRADLGDRGIFYRLRAGPVADRAEADRLCQSLAAENVGCLVVRNE